MAYTDIDKPSDYFDTLLSTGDGGSQTFTGLDFQPDWVWSKRRQTHVHQLYDSVRTAGSGKALQSDSSAAEGGDGGTYGYLSSFTSDGFASTAGSSNNNYFNASGGTYVFWNWKAGTSFTNDASATGIGSIDSTGSVNQDAGFSIVSFDLSGQSGNETIKHGLNTAPKVVITKRRSGGAGDWTSYFGAIGNSYLVLSSTNAGATNTSFMNNTAPTSSVFTVGDPSWWGANPFIAYCFSEKQGYSKFGSYTGNGNADGTFVYTGFKPAWLMIKRSSTGGDDWVMFDNKRSTSGANVIDKRLNPNSNNAEQSGDKMDFLSNGFKCIGTTNDMNGSGDTYTYMSFAENPFTTSSGVPATAR